MINKELEQKIEKEKNWLLEAGTNSYAYNIDIAFDSIKKAIQDTEMFEKQPCDDTVSKKALDDLIEVVIKIPKEMYKWVNNANKNLDDYNASDFWELIKNGAPLPKECDIQRIIPKKVDVQEWIDTKCPNPNCNCELSTHHGDGYYTIENKSNFCPNCGQALLWEESEEKI